MLPTVGENVRATMSRARVGPVRRTSPQLPDRRLLVSECLKKSEREFGRIERLLG